MKQRYQEMLQKLNKTPPAESDHDKTVKADVCKCKQGCKRETKTSNHRDSMRSYKGSES